MYHRNKAVADGAASYYVDHFVDTRIARWNYGTKMRTLYDANNAEHRHREHTTIFNAAGEKRVPNRFDIILNKVQLVTPCHFLVQILALIQGTEVAETKEFRKNYQRTHAPDKQDRVSGISSSILCYRGQNIVPAWVDVDAGM